MKHIFFSLLIVSFCSLIKAQEPSDATESSFNFYLELITELSARNEEETDFNDLAYELYELWESPVEINSAQPYDFARLFWLTEYQLNNLIQYVDRLKPVVSIYELAYVPGFDTTLVMSLKPFIRISETSQTANHYKQSEHWVMLRMGTTIEKLNGYRDKKFEGDHWKQNLRYKYQFGEKVYAGFNVEKDAGEALFRESNKVGPDFYSGYLKVNKLGIFKTICVGNFSTGFGQGLVTGPGFALGKSSQAVNLVQRETGIRPYTSNDENRYFQGFATTVSIQPLDISLFFSYKKIDANIALKDSTGNVLEVSSLQNTGYHSTSSEIEDENALGEYTAGGRILYKKSNFQFGTTVITSKFDAKIAPTPETYNIFYFKGNQQTNIGVDYKLNFANTTLFGEEAIDAQGNPAFLNGVASNIAGRLQLSFLHRFYSRAYHTFYGNAFGENSRVQNEEGFYGGIRMPVARHVDVAFYADFFRFPWLKFRVDAPSHGREYMLHTTYNPSSTFSVYLQYRYRQKQVNSHDSSDFTNILVCNKSQRIRLHAIYSATDQLNLSTRIELGKYSVSASKRENSYLIYQDFVYTFRKLPLRINLRYALFETDSYDSRVYAYESDVLYAFSVSSYYKKGQRYYCMVKYSPLKMLDIWVKYSQSLLPEEKTISSGLYEIEGNSKSDFRMQVVLKF